MAKTGKFINNIQLHCNGIILLNDAQMSLGSCPKLFEKGWDFPIIFHCPFKKVIP